MSNMILSCSGVSMEFGGVHAVDDFSMRISEGETIGIIGPNGAGKTTIFNVFSRIYRQTAGTIVFNGECVDDVDQVGMARRGLFRTFQNIRLFSGMTVLDNVKVPLDYKGGYSIIDAFLHLPRQRRKEKEVSELAMNTLKLLELDSYAGKQATGLPYGLQRRVEIARALVSSPVMLLLDEPAAGLNPEEVFQLVDFLREIRRKFPSLAILVIEHRMDLVMNLCDYLYVQNFGKTIAQGIPADIQSDKAVLSAYLGEEKD